jgi:hypothetical protein
MLEGNAAESALVLKSLRNERRSVDMMRYLLRMG